jgi:excisionase family DNA binding protein
MKPAPITANGTTASVQDDREWLTPAEIAAELKLTTAFIYAEIQSGRLASCRFGKYLRVTRAALRAYQAERRNGGGR